MVHRHFDQVLRDEFDIVGAGRGDGSAATEQREAQPGELASLDGRRRAWILERDHADA